MKLKTLLPLAFIVASGSTFAAQQDVAKVSSLTGQVLLEKQNGTRTPLQAGMILKEGENIMVLEKSSVKLVYTESSCVADYVANTLLPISAANQCATGQVLAIGQAIVDVSVEALKAAAEAVQAARELGATVSAGEALPEGALPAGELTNAMISDSAFSNVLEAVLATKASLAETIAALQAAFGPLVDIGTLLQSYAAAGGAATGVSSATLAAAGTAIIEGGGVFATVTGLSGAAIIGLTIVGGIVYAAAADDNSVSF